MDELRAAMGLVQLKRLRIWNEKRRGLCRIYRQLLAVHTPEIILPFDNTSETSAHLMPVLVPAKINRNGIMKRMREDGIQTSIHYPPIHQFSYYREKFPGVILPETEKFCDRELTLPLHPSLTENDVERIVLTLEKAMNS
jgi:dTDP-4-amino-4,6-dideoxygalactose transaminase